MTRGPGGRRAFIVLTLFGVVAGVFFFAAPLLGIDGAAAARQWLAQAQGPWALAAVIAVFAALAFIGVPQVALIAAAVAVFGAWRGAGYAWTGTMVSALIGFAIGRVVGGRAVSGMGGDGFDRFMRLVGKNGMLASLVVRLVPMAPFVMVNTAAGVAPISIVDFIVGTAIGIIPKIALTAFAGDALIRLIHGGR